MTDERPEPYIEGYTRIEGSELAQRLQDEGLLGAINGLVLHPLGLALGVSGNPRPRNPKTLDVIGLGLWDTKDPEGWEYDADGRRTTLAKLRASGHRELAKALVEVWHLKYPDEYVRGEFD